MPEEHSSSEQKSGTDKSPAERNQVCTLGDEVDVIANCDHPIHGQASATDFQPDPETGVAPGFTRCRNMRSRCRCSMCPAIHINSRSWLRSSSTHEPSDPPLRVVSRHGDHFLPDATRRRKLERSRPLTNFDSDNSTEQNNESFGAAHPFKSGEGFPMQQDSAL